MSSYSGVCFVALTPNSEKKSVIFGRNSFQPDGEVQEVLYYGTTSEDQTVKCDGGVEIDRKPTSSAVILQKSGSVIWGGESGANDKNVCIGITWSDGEPNENSLKSIDVVRLALEISQTAAEAVDEIGSLVASHGDDNSKFSFVVCDEEEVWLVSTGGKLWAAEQITSGFRGIPSDGLSISSKIDKSSDNLGEKLQALGLWDGSGDLDFAKSFSSAPTEQPWSGTEPSGDGSYILTSMFETLRSAANDKTRSSCVSVLSSSGISCHWFTATPNPSESVFKPFVFTTNPKISPLTKIADGETTTLLHKLHGQRKWEAVGDLLKFLETSCVEELSKYLGENPEPTQELDELLKDCVEAEVKFYR